MTYRCSKQEYSIGIRIKQVAICFVLFISAVSSGVTYYVDDVNGNDAWEGINPYGGDPNGPKKTIESAITVSVSGDVIVVADGVYTGIGNRNLDFGMGGVTRDITVGSANGPKNCVIDCEDFGRGFYFHSNESQLAVVEGLTIRNGNTTDGGGRKITNYR